MHNAAFMKMEQACSDSFDDAELLVKRELGLNNCRIERPAAAVLHDQVHIGFIHAHAKNSNNVRVISNVEHK